MNEHERAHQVLLSATHGEQAVIAMLERQRHTQVRAPAGLAHLLQFLLERSGDGDGVKHGIHGHVGQALLLIQRDTQLIKRGQQLRVHLEGEGKKGGAASSVTTSGAIAVAGTLAVAGHAQARRPAQHMLLCSADNTCQQLACHLTTGCAAARPNAAQMLLPICACLVQRLLLFQSLGGGIVGDVL